MSCSPRRRLTSADLVIEFKPCYYPSLDVFGAGASYSATLTSTATDGTFTITVNGQTTAALDHDANESTIESAVEGLSSVGAGNLTVSGSGPFTLTATGDLVNTALSVSVDDDLAVGGTVVLSAVSQGYPAATTPSYEEDQNHISLLTFAGSVTGGTFRLRVNGYRTAPIDHDATASEIQTALEALPSIGVGNIIVHSDPPFVIEAAGDLVNQFLLISLETSLVGTGSLTHTYRAIGSSQITLSNDVSSFSYSDTQETTDTTAIADKARSHSQTVSDLTWDAMIYEALQDWSSILFRGVEGWITVYENGKGSGKRYFAMPVMFLTVGSDFSAQEKIEISLSGRRQGDYLFPPGSYQD